MFLRVLQRRPFVASVALIALATATTAKAADITSANPRIENGKLVITGTTTTAGIKVRLDGQTGSAFNVASSPNRTFSFNLVYLPSDCIVTLQKVTGSSTLGAPSDWVVANCGTGLSPRGAWSSAIPYLANDLVTHQGSSWRAKRKNLNKTPVAGPDWELFAAKGAKGDPGAPGPPGSDGGSPTVRLVAATCNDSGGWTADPNSDLRVYCLGACAVGEVVSNSRIERTLRDGSAVNVAIDPAFDPAAPPPPEPRPGGRWYALFFANRATDHPDRAEQFSSVTLRLSCTAA